MAASQRDKNGQKRCKTVGVKVQQLIHFRLNGKRSVFKMHWIDDARVKIPTVEREETLILFFEFSALKTWFE